MEQNITNSAVKRHQHRIISYIGEAIMEKTPTDGDFRIKMYQKNDTASQKNQFSPEMNNKEWYSQFRAQKSSFHPIIERIADQELLSENQNINIENLQHDCYMECPTFILRDQSQHQGGKILQQNGERNPLASGIQQIYQDISNQVSIFGKKKIQKRVINFKTQKSQTKQKQKTFLQKQILKDFNTINLIQGNNPNFTNQNLNDDILEQTEYEQTKMKIDHNGNCKIHATSNINTNDIECDDPIITDSININNCNQITQYAGHLNNYNHIKTVINKSQFTNVFTISSILMKNQPEIPEVQQYCFTAKVLGHFQQWGLVQFSLQFLENVNINFASPLMKNSIICATYNFSVQGNNLFCQFELGGVLQFSTKFPLRQVTTTSGEIINYVIIDRITKYFGMKNNKL